MFCFSAMRDNKKEDKAPGVKGSGFAAAMIVFIELDFPWRHATQIRVETHDRLDNHLDKLTAGAAT